MITSAGFVVFNPNTKKFLLIKNSKGHWDFPKGHVERGENILQAALRETKEECGLTPKPITGFLERIEYYVYEGGKKQKKHVYFFLGTVDSTQVRLSFEHEDYKWLSFEEAYSLLKYQNQKMLLQKAYDFLKTKGLARVNEF